MAFPGSSDPAGSPDRSVETRTDHTVLRLSAADIAQTVSVAQVLDLLAAGFRAAGRRSPRVSAEPRTAMDPHERLQGRLPEIPAYTVRMDVRPWGPTRAARGTVCLHDLATDALLAVLDGAGVAAWRTGLAAALATHTLADPAAATLGFIGAGARARAASAGLRHLRRWRRVVATDDSSALSAEARSNPGAVIAEAGAVVLATTPRPPHLRPADVRPGQHLTFLGGEPPSRWQLPPALLLGGRLIVDDIDAAMAAGVLGATGLNADHCDGTLGQVLRGEVAAHDPDRRSVYAAAGLPWQDLALSWVVYQHALAAGVGTTIESAPHPSHPRPRLSPTPSRRLPSP